jgi:hypothetical protein
MCKAVSQSPPHIPSDRIPHVIFEAKRSEASRAARAAVAYEYECEYEYEYESHLHTSREKNHAHLA